MLLIRPHHINCLFFYRGLGYSPEFTENMNKIRDTLIKNLNTEIRLVSHCDSICKSCPNQTPLNVCIFYDKVESLDNNTLNYYGLDDNAKYSFKEIIDNIYMNYDNNKFINICSKCEWYKKGVCSENLIDERKKYWHETCSNT